MQRLEKHVKRRDTDAPWVRKRLVMAALHGAPFKPASWLPGKHAQTCFGPFFRKGGRLKMRTERWETPDDDFVDVLFHDAAADGPIVLMLHGLEGKPRSFYMDGFARRFAKEGWTMAALMFRTCGIEMCRGRRFYHLGETRDLTLAVERITEMYPDRPLFAMGISLGGSVLIHWLADQGDARPDNLRAAAAVSVPFDPEASAPVLNNALGGAYVRYFLHTLRRKSEEKAKQHPDLFDIEKVRRCKSLIEFDNLVTAPVHGFEDANDYYRKCACKSRVQHVQTPLLLINAEDDPFMAPNTLPRAEVEESPYLHPLFTRRGGHVGFVGGAPWKPHYWAEERVEQFFRLHLESEEAHDTIMD